MCYLKLQLGSQRLPSDPTLSPKYRVHNLSMRISRPRLAPEITLPNLRSGLLKSGLVSPRASRSPIPLSKAEELDEASLGQDQPTRGKSTAKALMVFQACSVTRKKNIVMRKPAKNNKDRTEKHVRKTVGAHNSLIILLILLHRNVTFPSCC